MVGTFALVDTELALGERVALHAFSVGAALEIRRSPELTLQLAAGSPVGGTLEVAGNRHDLGPGVLLAAGASYRLVDGAGAAPFVVVSGTLGASTFSTDGPAGERSRMNAGDVRAGVVVGKTLLDLVSPYVVARGFFGPVSFRARVAGQPKDLDGGDAHHYQVGAGLVTAFRGVDLALEGMPLGEKRVVAALGVSF